MRIASIEMDEEEEMREINGPTAAGPIAAPAAAAVISPYRMNPGYRRPPPPGTGRHTNGVKIIWAIFTLSVLI